MGTPDERIDDVYKQLTQIHVAILSIARPDYQTMAVFAGVVIAAMTALWGLAIRPVNDDIARLYSISKEISMKIDADAKLIDATKVSKDEFNPEMAYIKRGLEDLNIQLKSGKK